MPLFTFEAVDATGTRVRGSESASSSAALTSALEARGLYLLDVVEATASSGWPLSMGYRRDVLEFTRAMSALLPAGLPLARALESAAGVTNGMVRDAVLDVRARVVRGEMLATALAAFPAQFSPLYRGIVRAGERSGDLDGAFARLASQLDREEQLRGRVLTATLYPVLLAVAGACAIAVLLLVVLPQFTSLLTEAGAVLPRSTQLLVSTSQLLVRAWPLLAGSVVGLVALALWMQRTVEGRRARARLLLSLPLVHTLRRQVVGARMARLLAALLGGGAPLYTALGDVVESLDDPIARDETVLVRQRVREGASLRSAIAASPLFPAVLAQLVGVGEEASQLREFLFKAADILDERAERTAQRLATLAEPTLIVIFGAIVALIAFALLQAIYGINAGSFVR
jgi:type II secretory pathway component PulF